MNGSSITPVLTSAHAAEAQPRVSDYWEMTKPRLSLMSVATAILGYFAAGPELHLQTFACLLAGTTLAAFGAGVLNQWWEREADAQMRRTRDRPIAAGRVSPMAALVYGLLLSVLGPVLMMYGVNAVASALTAATILLYIFAYTPLKRRTPWATEIGAIPGALPPLIGWIAAGGGFSALGWILFGVLFAWQIPHFMAICWNFRKEYASAGFRMLPLYDPSGDRVGFKACFWTVILMGVGLLPVQTPEIGWVFAIISLLLGVYMLIPAVRFAYSKDRTQAGRQLFMATLVYLPVYLGALVVDRFFI